MARILASGEWYEPIAPGSMYEDNFEQLILGQASYLFPQYDVVPFKSLVASESETARPDLALVERQYRDWWVVEVEMGYHSLFGHVLPQIRTLAGAAYGEREADSLCAEAVILERSAVRDMMKGAQPRVLVIVNEQKPDWAQALDRYGARLVTVEVFRSDRNRYLFSTSGQMPTHTGNVVSRCYLEPGLPRLLAVESPGGLRILPHAHVTLWYDGQVTQWERIDTRDKVWLNPIAKNPLLPGVSYNLIQRSDGLFEIQPE